ncbi:MAG: hypothetical protein FWH53_05390 [Leptospirales bacterium]|nr:hypothetical protein [Leptospirales bacterium]
MKIILFEKTQLKNLKANNLLKPMLAASMVFALIAVTLPFISCGGDDDNNNEQPKMGSFTIDGIAGATYSIKVQHPGSLDAGEISDIKTKLTDALNNIGIPAFTDPDEILRCGEVLGNRGLVIVVEESGAPYPGYKEIDYRTISFHIDWLSLPGTTDSILAAEIAAAIYDTLYPMVATNSLTNEWLLAAIQRQKGYERN